MVSDMGHGPPVLVIRGFCLFCLLILIKQNSGYEISVCCKRFEWQQCVQYNNIILHINVNDELSINCVNISKLQV